METTKQYSRSKKRTFIRKCTTLAAITMFATVSSLSLFNQNTKFLASPAEAATLTAETTALTAIADAFVRSDYLSSNYGTRTQLEIHNPTLEKIGYLKFELGVEPVTTAKLRLYVTDGSKSNYTIRPVSNASWSETTITYGNKPAIGTAIATLPISVNGQWVEVDVTSALQARSGQYISLAIFAEGSDGLIVSSREAVNKPQLIVSSAASTSTPTPTTTPAPVTLCTPPYAASSYWNTPIGSNATYESQSSYITELGTTLTSKVSQYTMPVYMVDATTPVRTVTLTGLYSDVSDDAKITNLSQPTLAIPVPSGAMPAEGGDAQMILWNQTTGDEWAFWHVVANADGTYSAENGYHYNTKWDGVPPRKGEGINTSNFVSRGAGVPYLTGLVRPCEIAQGHIDHAIAFAFNSPAPQAVYPATKSDGAGIVGVDLPEGARLQLDPSISDSTIQTEWGCTGNCFIIAKALQKYGMVVIDKPGSTKIYAEYEGTAHWNGAITDSTVSPIPLSNFKVLNFTTDYAAWTTGTTATPTQTVTPTPSPSPTASPTPSSTPIPTATVTPTATPTASPVPTSTGTIPTGAKHVYPGQSISSALSSITSGGTIVLHGGTYSVGTLSLSGSSKSNVTIMAAPGERPVIKGLVRISNANGWVLDGFNVQWGGGTSGDHMFKMTGGNGWTIKNSEIWGAQSYANLHITGGATNYKVINNYIHNVADLSAVNSEVQNHNIYVADGDYGLIAGNVIENAPRGRCIKIANSSATSTSNPDYNRVAYNTFRNCTGPSLVGVSYGASYNVFDHNSFENGPCIMNAKDISGTGNAMRDNVYWNITNDCIVRDGTLTITNMIKADPGTISGFGAQAYKSGL